MPEPANTSIPPQPPPAAPAAEPAITQPGSTPAETQPVSTQWGSTPANNSTETPTTAAGSRPPAGVFSRTYRTTSVGLFSLAFLFAFEALAVATVMPVVARDLDGLAIYALAFGAPMALSVVSIGLGGGWSDARGPAPALRLGVLLFAAGLVVAALAPTMGVLLLGRGLQGFGSGLAGVAMYVVVARAFPAALRPQAFTILTSGWVLPGIIGPVLAGLINAALGWRWVFGLAPVLAVLAYLALEPVLRRIGSNGSWRTSPAKLLWSLAAAGGILGLGSIGSLGADGPGPAGWILLLAAVSTAAVLTGGPRLLPRGTWTVRRGLPAVIASRGFVGAAFVGAETYLPLALVEQRGFSPTQAGALLSVSALSWFAGSWLAANLRMLSSKVLRARLGALLLAAGVAPVLAAVHPQLPVSIVVAGWAVAGLGIGMGFSTLSVLLLDFSRTGEEGVNSSALQINDNLVQSLWLAVSGIGFSALLAVSHVHAFTAVFCGALGLALAAVAATGRLQPPPGR
ncbi:MFS transporter [Arthrobacter sp. Helios]|uniref:MFS transporter n=1 Tax=Arthrobacter sp. Helios TaxID=2828862 RepID=UPI0020686668|nr:MFS transporter [Arthrobacter sp. Helios]UPO77421.1 MFS transporter [Arthrobacter sp. Helios]